jgi:hypothetical protein
MARAVSLMPVYGRMRMLVEKVIANIMDDNKRKALQAALSQIEKQFGKGSIMKLGEAEIAQDIQAVPTGSLGLDIALGVGGLPRGRIVEIYGPDPNRRARPPSRCR